MYKVTYLFGKGLPAFMYTVINTPRKGLPISTCGLQIRHLCLRVSTHYLDSFKLILRTVTNLLVCDRRVGFTNQYYIGCRPVISNVTNPMWRIVHHSVHDYHSFAIRRRTRYPLPCTKIPFCFIQLHPCSIDSILFCASYLPIPDWVWGYLLSII
jgi:hypothetical protein